MRNFLIKFIIIAIIIRLIIYIIINQNFFTREFDITYLSDTYSKSQYVLGPASKNGIGDDGLYTFAGYYYLFQKGDVSAVNFEHPPLGKYLIGLSVLILKNENLINVIYFVILLIVTYRLGQMLLKDNLLSMISTGILATDPLFLDNLIRSLLDLPFTLFSTLAVYFFILGLQKPKYNYLSFVFWGAAFSTRFFPFMVVIFCFLLAVTFLYKRENLRIFLLSSLIIPVIYLISHISFFVYHPSLVEFLRHKKWMLSWFSGSKRIAGNIWINIFTGYYLDTTGKLVRNEYWIITISMMVTLALLQIRRFALKNIGMLVIYGICLLYLIYLTFLTDGVAKFLMPIYPLLCILAVRNLNIFYSIIAAWKKKN